MSRWIDADALIEFFKEVRMELNPSQYSSAIEFHTRDNILLNVIQTIQHTEKKEIVPCQDCKYWVSNFNGCSRNPCTEPWLATDFCNYGEKK